MKASLFQPNPLVPVVDWDKFKGLPQNEPLVSPLDLGVVNARLAPHQTHPYRWLRGTFRVPEDVSAEVLRKVAAEKIKEFIKAKEAQGWALVGRPEVYPSRFARTLEIDGSGGQQGTREVVVRAPFRKLDFRPIRINVSELL